MNRIHNEDRNKMVTETCNKATYIAMNEKAFARQELLGDDEIGALTLAFKDILMEDHWHKYNFLARERNRMRMTSLSKVWAPWERVLGACFGVVLMVDLGVLLLIIASFLS
jgi:hypothetical protein